MRWLGDGLAEILGNIAGQRVPSRVLDEWIQAAVRAGATHLRIHADGQHGIGGRIHPQGHPVRIEVYGPVGQRLGGMGMEGTEIVVHGPASDDVGWLNCGAKITVLGDVGNGAWNAAAQGVLYVQGSGGARCDTLTKHNPRFAPPQSWYFRDVGDSFAEFKAGGITVVCGVAPRDPESVLGYRPCVGMVGGVIYFRGRIAEYSRADVRLAELDDADWAWLCANLPVFLAAIDRMGYLAELTAERAQWRKLVALSPQERTSRPWIPISISEFRKKHWEAAVGDGGLFAEYLNHEPGVLPYIVTGRDRLFRPVWQNEKYAAPCEFACPVGIPTRQRTALLRNGQIAEAVALALRYSPLPVTVCGHVCPNLCMQNCSRAALDSPVSIDALGRAAMEAPTPPAAAPTGKRVAVVGGGPAGLAAAWHLALLGHHVCIYEAESKLGGKLELCVPQERLPRQVLAAELDRIQRLGIELKLNTPVTAQLFEAIRSEYDAVVIACGAHKPRQLRFPGSEHVVSAYEFLRKYNVGAADSLSGKSVVVIGAGNVGMDVASAAFALGASAVVALDIQKPAAFGRELELAMARGARIVWPKQVSRFDPVSRRVLCADGSEFPADVVICAIGDVPKLDFVPEEMVDPRGWLRVDASFRTADPKVFAVGDVTGLGLAAHALGHGRAAALRIHSFLTGGADRPMRAPALIPAGRVKVQYYERACPAADPVAEAFRCMSCGKCRDCRMCESVCYWGAIRRVEDPATGFRYEVDDDKCIGCGFCAGACPCGVWEMVPNNGGAGSDPSAEHAVD